MSLSAQRKEALQTLRGLGLTAKDDAEWGEIIVTLKPAEIVKLWPAITRPKSITAKAEAVAIHCPRDEPDEALAMGRELRRWADRRAAR